MTTLWALDIQLMFIPPASFELEFQIAAFTWGYTKKKFCIDMVNGARKNTLTHVESRRLMFALQRNANDSSESVPAQLVELSNFWICGMNKNSDC
jgi:hypothetical protein